MKKIVTFLCLTLLFITTPNAMWIKLSNKELLDSSQLIVNATLKNDVKSEAQDLHLKVLQITQFYKNQTSSKQVYLLLPSKNRPMSSSDLSYPTGQKGIWFLKEAAPGSGVFFIDHPQRVWPLENESILLELLK